MMLGSDLSLFMPFVIYRSMHSHTLVVIKIEDDLLVFVI